MSRAGSEASWALPLQADRSLSPHSSQRAQQGDPYNSLQRAGPGRQRRAGSLLSTPLWGYRVGSGDRAWSQEDCSRELSKPFWKVRATGHDCYVLAQGQDEEALSTDHE